MDRNLDGAFYYFMWMVNYFLSCVFLTILMIIYNTTLGKIIDHIRRKPIRRALIYPDENTIKERG